MSSGEGDGCVLKLPEGEGLDKFVITATAGTGESAGENEGFCKSELSALLTSLKPRVWLRKPGLLPRSHKKPANAAKATTIIRSTRTRADLVALFSTGATSEFPAATAVAALFLQKTSWPPRADDDARWVAAKCKVQSAPGAPAAHQTPFRQRVRQRARCPN
jgi:hypothetical protein